MVYEAAKSGLTDLDLPYVILPRLIRRRSVVPSKGPRVIIGSNALPLLQRADNTAFPLYCSEVERKFPFIPCTSTLFGSRLNLARGTESTS